MLFALLFLAFLSLQALTAPTTLTEAIHSLDSSLQLLSTCFRNLSIPQEVCSRKSEFKRAYNESLMLASMAKPSEYGLVTALKAETTHSAKMISVLLELLWLHPSALPQKLYDDPHTDVWFWILGSNWLATYGSLFRHVFMLLYRLGDSLSKYGYSPHGRSGWWGVRAHDNVYESVRAMHRLTDMKLHWDAKSTALELAHERYLLGDCWRRACLMGCEEHPDVHERRACLFNSAHQVLTFSVASIKYPVHRYPDSEKNLAHYLLRSQMLVQAAFEQNLQSALMTMTFVSPPDGRYWLYWYRLLSNGFPSLPLFDSVRGTLTFEEESFETLFVDVEDFPENADMKGKCPYKSNKQLLLWQQRMPAEEVFWRYTLSAKTDPWIPLALDPERPLQGRLEDLLVEVWLSREEKRHRRGEEGEAQLKKLFIQNLESFKNLRDTEIFLRNHVEGDLEDVDFLRRFREFTPHILDMGAGPLSLVGPVSSFFGPLKITPIDPLAPLYNSLMKRLEIAPPHSPQLGTGESFLSSFKGKCDLAISINAIDHAKDPILILENMLRSTGDSGRVVIVVGRNESVANGGEGLHAWNFDVEEERLTLWQYVKGKGEKVRSVVDVEDELRRRQTKASSSSSLFGFSVDSHIIDALNQEAWVGWDLIGPWPFYNPKAASREYVVAVFRKL